MAPSGLRTMVPAVSRARPAEPRAIVRLDRCPECNYDLSGLARRHTCPECGLAYDQRMFIVEGKPRRGNYWDSQAAAIFFLWFVVMGIAFGRRMGLGPFLMFMVLSYAAIWVAAWGLQRLRQRPGKALLIWVSAEGIAIQPAFRWRKRQPWSRFRRVNASPAARFLPRADPGRWRLRVRPRWPQILYDRGIDVFVRCSKREIALLRNAMRRLMRGAKSATASCVKA